MTASKGRCGLKMEREVAAVTSAFRYGCHKRISAITRILVSLQDSKFDREHKIAVIESILLSRRTSMTHH